MAELISLREYGRRKGYSDAAVRKAIKTGKIVNGVVYNDDGRPSINPLIADAEWNINKDPSYQRIRKDGKPTIETTELNSEPIFFDKAEGKDIQFGKPQESNVKIKKSLADIKRDTADIKLRMAAIELQEKMGKLVDKEKVYKALFSAGQEVRTTFQSIPDRVIDEVLSATSRNEAHGVLFDAIADALEKLSEILNRKINT